MQGERQPGSSFKPFVLATALQDGISPVSEFDSKPVEIFTGDRVWVVHNYEGDYIGRANLQTATTYSDNSIYAQLTDLVGPASVVKTAHTMGITSPLKDYFSIGLGAQAVNPLEMARAYSTLANGGYRIDGAITGNHARAIVSVGGNASGGCSGENKAVANRAISPTTAKVINSILQTVVTQGTGKRAQLADGRQVAGKTGTTENYGDAWFVGYTPQLVTAVWVGYPDKLRPMLTQFNGDPVAGGTYPALIWKAFMERALTYLKDSPATFQPPPSTWGSSALVLNRNGRGRGGQRLLPRPADGRLPPRRGADEEGELQAERGAGAERDRQADRAREGTPGRAAAQGADPVQALDAAAAAGNRAAAISEGRDALVLRPGHALPRQAATRGRPVRDRVAARTGPVEAGGGEAAAAGGEGGTAAEAARSRSVPGASGRRRSVSGDGDPPYRGRIARLRKREPARA